MQTADTVLMIRPANFGFNAETAATNFFQQPTDIAGLQHQALKEFDNMVQVLTDHQIDVIVVADTEEPAKPDAIFPNNWISTERNGNICVFPMLAKSRRLERRNDIVELLSQKFQVTQVQDWSHYETEDKYLEGTGSLVIDHQHKLVYACLSPRTNQFLVEKFAALNGYRAICFTAHDSNGNSVYHTNVMMCIGEGFAVLCPKAIVDHDERVAVAQLLETTGHDNLYITPEQMHAFAGNMLHLKNKSGNRFIVMSQTALNTLDSHQVLQLEQFGKILAIDVATIEKVEGGSVRCMMAEVFLKKNSSPVIQLT